MDMRAKLTYERAMAEFDEGRRLAVAVSGGGHRATVWGWGAMLALTDAGLNRDVVSIASVSGGSIANGVVANAGDFSRMTPAEFEAAISPALGVASREGLFFFGPATDGYVRRFLLTAGLGVAAIVAASVAFVGAGRGWRLPAWALIGPGLAVLVWFGGLRRKKKPAPPLPPAAQVALLAGLLLAGPLAVAFLAVTTNAHGAALAAGLVGVALAPALAVWLALRTFSLRSVVVDEALGRTLLASDGGPTRLADVDRSVHHVFCVTELQSGDHAYLTPRLVYSYRAGRGTPGALPLSSAVQASACLPGAFVPRELHTAPFSMTRPWSVGDDVPKTVPERLVVNDGGVYDNMADQWEQGYESRARRLPDLPELQRRADVLLVVNASKALGWSGLPKANRIAAEVRSLTRTIDILYDVSTSHRRQGLIDRFEAEGRLRGALVHIAQSPFVVPNAFLKKKRDPQAQARAREALDFLADIGAREDEWEERAARNAGVKTTLAALGPQVTADLLEHAYLLTTVNAYVILGLGSLPRGPSDTGPFARSRFEALA